MEPYRHGQVLNRDLLKMIAAAAMLLDHIAWRFLPFSSAAAQVFHTIGRITLPVMCYFIAEGFLYTRSKRKYALRLLLFALISQIPYAMFHGNPWYASNCNVIFTLWFCFLAVYCYDHIQNAPVRWLAILGCTAATMWCDWSITAVLFTLTFHAYWEDRVKQIAAFSAVTAFYFCTELSAKLFAGVPVVSATRSSLYTLGVLLALVPLTLYNARKGRFLAGAWGKWFFYLFYPAHLLLLAMS